MAEVELKRLVRKRAGFKKSLTEFRKFIDQRSNSDSVLNRIHILEIESKLNHISNLMKEFESTQDQINDLQECDEIGEECVEFETAYHQVVAAAKYLLETAACMSDSNSVLPESRNVLNDIGQLNTEIMHASVKLPNIEIKKFSGNYTQWLEFRDSYCAMIHDSNVLNNVQKFYYLKAFLEGDAAKLIASINTTANNYPIAWKRLLDRYESKRLLVHNHISAFMNLPKMSKESTSQLREMLDAARLHLQSLISLGVDIDSWDPIIVYILNSKLDNTTAREWELHVNANEIPTFEEMAEFITQRANMLEILKVGKINIQDSEKGKYNSKFHNAQRTKAFVTTQLKCYNCKDSHTIYNCPELGRLSVRHRIEKIKRLDLCLNCLKPGHAAKDCVAIGCRKCNHKHNSLLHIEKSRRQNQTSCNNENTQTNVSMHAWNDDNSCSYTLLSTCHMQIENKGKLHTVRAILDSGSQSNFITERVVQKLGLDIKNTNLKIAGINNSLTDVAGKCKFKYMSRDKSYSKEIECLVVPEISGILPQAPIDTKDWKLPKDLFLADPKFNIPDMVDILIGANEFWNLMSTNKLSLGTGNPYAYKTRLGWVISGQIILPYSKVHCNFNKNTDIQSQLAKFWEIEEVKEVPIWTEEELLCEQHFIDNVSRTSNGRFEISIPFTKSLAMLGDSRQGALKRFYSLERKLQANPSLKQMYDEFMDEYERLGHMKVIDSQKTDDIEYFIPHHCVYKESSLTTKLRVVFDASFSSSSGLSRNDLEAVGPTIQSDLLTILLRFRQYPIAITADICKMYRQILVKKEERALQKIFWRKDPKEKLKCYVLNTLTYGTASASFNATRCLKQLAMENEDKYKRACRAILEDFYMDDLLTGTYDIAEAMQICSEINDILSQGCFQLRKWLSNKPEVLLHVSKIDSVDKLILDEEKTTKTLGLYWNSKLDTFSFSVTDLDIKETPTKRSLLSTISKIFDPLGLICASTIIAKVMLQDVWRENIAWDSELPQRLQDKWKKLATQLLKLNDLNISRFILIKNYMNLQIHGFSDASETAYGACIYLRCETPEGNIQTKLLCAKSKVAPLKVITIPKLELCAALLLSKLLKHVIKSMRLKYKSIYLWSDSQIVLAWLRLPPNSMKIFVSHRIVQILENTKGSEWRYVPSKLNPADIISRGCYPSELSKCVSWWNGPAFLSTNDWPLQPNRMTEPVPEMRLNKVSLITKIICSVVEVERFSSLTKLTRVLAYVNRFIHNLRNVRNKLSGYLLHTEVNAALILIIHLKQREAFAEDYYRLQKGLPLSKQSKISSLNPFLDKGVIRVGGRLNHAQLDYAQRHPIILPPSNHLTKLIFQQAHIAHGHIGPQQLLYTIRENYWPLRGKAIAKQIVRQCVVCFKNSPRNAYPLMGSLPENRVSPSFPFEVTGVDYAGPLKIKSQSGRGAKQRKCYIALFVCFSTKAVHIEVVSDLSTQKFIDALKRFTTRRGKPKLIVSDNATNFSGANSELKAICKDLLHDESYIVNSLASENINWKFTPPRAPHHGGIWESLIKRAKFHLKRIIGNEILTFEDLYTVMCQIESILNSRPMYPMSDDPEDFEPICPSHFLIGRRLTSVPSQDVSSIKEGRLQNYQRLQRYIATFWQRWSKDYLYSLQRRKCWNQTNYININLNDLVLLQEDNVPPLRWQIGRISKLYPGADGIVRVVDVSTAKGTYKRSVTKVYPLPKIEEESISGAENLNHECHCVESE